MTNNQYKIKQLLLQLENLSLRQDAFAREINHLRTEIQRLQASEKDEKAPTETQQASAPVESRTLEPQKKVEMKSYLVETEEPNSEQIISDRKQESKVKSDLEKFIGENLINKIGIIITIIGVAIGAKYSIEHDLISPLTRIIFGYLSGLGLLGLGLKLKKKYKSYSAVLLSGAMAIMYFMTYLAHSFYDLIPQLGAFALMLLFTAFTVTAAINYNKQVIAHIGLVGAYAVPFLLSDGSGNVATLFAYMAIINIGILIIAFKKYWKPIYYFSFGLTWLIYFAWFTTKYETSQHFSMALLFLSLFFTIFYVTFLAYKLLQKEKFQFDDIVLLLSNSFVFYGFGYAILNGHSTGKEMLGVFTLCNAFIHFIFSVVIYRQKLADRNLFYLISGLMLLFITIAIPVQLDGRWVTLLWAGEAALLFWIGRAKKIWVYEEISLGIMLFAFGSLLVDWVSVYDGYDPEIPGSRIISLFNINFLTSALFIGFFGFTSYVSRKYHSIMAEEKGLSTIISIFITSILIFVSYYAFHMEIANYWNQLYVDSKIAIKQEGQMHMSHYHNRDLKEFKIISLINYALLFTSLLAFINIKKIKNQKLGIVNLLLLLMVLIFFLSVGLYSLSELRETYLSQSLSQYYSRGIFNLLSRYISFAFVGMALVACYQYIRQAFIQVKLRIVFDFLLYTTILWIASSELINWMQIANSTQSYKLGLSILWGLNALFLIVLGIAKKKKHLRVGAICLFGVTLIKLFLYDISHLTTIAKTIVFVSLGILLLIISFLYNKYKHLIAEDQD